MSATDHATAPHTALPAGAPSHRSRIASTTVVIGLCSANHCSADGIDSTGTNADEMNVIGKISVNPMPFAASGDDTRRPISAKNHARGGPVEGIPYLWASPEPLDGGRCRYRTSDDDLDWLALRLGMIGVEFRVDAPSALAQRVAAVGARLGRAAGAPGDRRFPDGAAGNVAGGRDERTP